MKIVYDKPGRLRIRKGSGAFSRVQAMGIQAFLLTYPWIISADVNHVNGGILVSYQPEQREGLLQIINRLSETNLPVVEESHEIKELDRNFVRNAILLLGKHYINKFFLPAPVRALITVYHAFSFWKKGLSSLGQGRLDVDVLDAAAVTAAISQRDFGTASSIITLLRVSELLEDYTRKKTRQTLSQSLSQNIDKVWLTGGDADILVPVSKVQVGDLIRVRTGATIPLDGEINRGEAIINEASMTGEALGIARRPGHSVYAGTVVEDGDVVITVTTLANDTRLQSIVAFIDRSETLKADVQGKAESLADAIVPFSFIASAAVWAFTGQLTKALAVLMVDYSCAIKLTTPICIITAMREAANDGILIKGGKHLEAYANADTIIFDKTGTLTNACPQVAKVISFDNWSRDEVLKIAACLEEHYPHSMAKSIVRQAELENLNHEEEHADVNYIVAHGISSMLNNEPVLIGSWHFIFEDEEIPVSDAQKAIMDKEAEGYSAIYLAINNKPAGMICVEDPIRYDAKKVLKQLKKLGISRTIMLTGDGEAAALAAAEALGIEEYQSQMLPEDKAAFVQNLKQAGHRVIMVGDGINDSPALSCADVSVAMKDGSDIAKAVADITLLSDDLSGLVKLRKLCNSVFARIHRNYGIILGVNTGLLVFGIAGTITPATSAVLHNAGTMFLCGDSVRSYE